MKLGTPVYAGSARFAGHVVGIFQTTVSVHIDQLGTIRIFPRGKVITRKRLPDFAVGEAVNIVVDETLCRGEVIHNRPLRAKVTDGHPVWQGCEVSGKEAAIGKVEEAE